MKWIVGLGNPGLKYRGTRHNIGFMVVDALADKHGIQIKQAKVKGLIGEGVIGGEKVALIKPMTYMNLSGECVRAFMDYYKADPQDLIVVYDDLDTNLGRIRLRFQGSSGGHNGIKSIIAHLGTQTFNRVRMGISRPDPTRDIMIIDYVLGTFARRDKDLLTEMVDKACAALEFSLDHTWEQTMAKYNA